MDDETTTALVHALASPNPQERFQAALALGQRGDRRALHVLNEAIDEGDEPTRWAAEQALSQIVRAKANGERNADLVEKLKSADEWEQFKAAEDLAKSGVDAGFSHLLRFLREGSKPIRVMTLACLRKIGDPRAVEPVLEALQDDRRDIRRFAAAALSAVPDSRSIIPLIKALSDPEDSDTRKWAVRGLQNIGEPARAFLLPLLEDEDVTLRELAAAALGKNGNEQSFQILMSALAGSQVSVAAFALALTNDSRTADALIGLLADDRANARSAAAWWLGEMGDRRAAIPLTAKLMDPDQWVRRNVQEALGKIMR